MAAFPKLIFWVLFVKFVSSNPTSSFSYNGFDRDLTSVANIALSGDAEFINSSSSFSSSSSWVQLTGSASKSSGLMLHKKPIKLIEGKPRKIVSFSTNFTFSISRKNGSGSGGGLAFVVVPIGYPLKVYGNSSFGLPFGSEGSGNRVFAVEFDTFKDDKYNDLNENHVGVDVGNVVSVKASNVSAISLVLNDGKKLTCWIDYEASSKRLEVRLSNVGAKKPMDTLLTYPVDITKVLKADEVFLGFSSSNGNSSQICLLHSWSFNVRHAFQWMHSQPLNPDGIVNLTQPSFVVQKRSSCILRIIVALIVGGGCGVLGAILVLYVWTMIGNRRPVAPEELTAVHPVEYEYKKIDVVCDQALKDDEKK